MSYDIRLIDPVTREAIEAEARHLMQGGTYVQGARLSFGSTLPTTTASTTAASWAMTASAPSTA